MVTNRRRHPSPSPPVESPVTIKTGTERTRKKNEPTRKGGKTTKAVPEATDGNTKAKAAAPLLVAARNRGRRVSDLDDPATSNVEAIAAAKSARKAPSLPKPANGRPPAAGDAAAETDPVKPARSQTRAKSRNQGAEAPPKSTRPQKPAQNDDCGPAIKPRATQPDATSQQSKVPNNTALRAKASSRENGTSVPIGPSKHCQAQKKTAGKTTKDSIYRAPNSSSTEQKRKARAEPHIAITTSKKDVIRTKLPVATQPSAKGAPTGGPGLSDQPATTRKRRAASAPVEGGGRASKRSRLEGEGDTDWRAAPVVIVKRHQDRDDGAMDVDTGAVVAEVGGGDAHANKESGGVCDGGADDGKQLAASESPPGIELTGGYGAFVGFALGAGAFALRHWS